MGRKLKERALEVYVGSSKVGLYVRARNGSTSFRYDHQWLSSGRAFPVSLSMPLSTRVWSGESTRNFFDGLLPDDFTVREKLAAREQADSAGVFDLLSVLGRDCVGALRFVPEGEDPGNPSKMSYRPVSDEEIAQRIASLAQIPLGVQGPDDFRISIAGAQEKTAFLKIDDQWQLPLGPTPTSHIFKPDMKEGPDGADFSDTPWNEWVCLKLCRALGVEAADAEVLIFGGKPVIAVERFDRVWKEGVLYRVPQEDLCQALGVSPSRKYQADGGPGIIHILQLLSGGQSPHEDRLKFMKAQIVFWLLAAIDGHAKNFSVFITPGGYKLTPLYDVMSASPYQQLPDQKIKLAMAVGDNKYYRIKQIQLRHFYQTAQSAGIKKQEMDELMDELAKQMDDVLASVQNEAEQAGVPKLTYEPILTGVAMRGRLLQPG